MSHWVLHAIDVDGTDVYINKRGGKTRDVSKAKLFSCCYRPHDYGRPWQWVSVECTTKCERCGVE